MALFEKDHPLEDPPPSVLPEEEVRRTRPADVDKKGVDFAEDEAGCETRLTSTCMTALARVYSNALQISEKRHGNFVVQKIVWTLLNRYKSCMCYIALVFAA